MENPENLSVENMDKLVKISLDFFNEFVTTAKSDDKEAQEKALKELINFKDALLNISQQALKETGLSSTELMEMMGSSDSLSPENAQAMKTMNDSITAFHTKLLSETMPEKHMPKTARAPKKEHISI
jgi:ABC-type molybdate transport system substrate-binding protein